MKFAAGKDNLVTRRLISCGFFKRIGIAAVRGLCWKVAL